MSVGTVWNPQGPQSGLWFDVAGAQRLFAEVEAFLEESTYTPEEKTGATWRIPIGDKEANLNNGEWQRATPQSCRMHQRITATQSTKLAPEDNKSTRSYQSIMQDTYDAKPFLLYAGGQCLDSYVGLCPGETKPGDVVAIIFGATAPLVLRPAGPDEMSQEFALVGEAYIHGAMDGEFVQGDCETKTFTLGKPAKGGIL